MGLPLFIAKLESDLPAKASSKDPVLAPANAGVQSARSRHRRIIPPSHAPSNEREARWRLEHTRGGRRFMRLIADENSRNPAIPQITLERIAALDTSPDPIDQAMDEFLQLDVPQRGRWAGELQQLLGRRWSEEGLRARARIMHLRNARARGRGPSDLRSRAAESFGTWTAEPRPQARRARVVSPVSPGTQATSALPSVELVNLRRLIEGMQRERRGESSNGTNDTPELSLREWARLSQASRHARVLDGLGDRQRSMSPEMWDTLLSTMTPDPEPPSASTSFATAQTQDTAATSFSIPEELRDMEGFLSEPPCEFSDPEDEGTAAAAAAPPAEAPRREGAPSEGPFTLRRAVSLTSARRNALRRRIEGRTDNPAPTDGASSASRNRPIRDGWVGTLSVGASDEGGVQIDRSARRPAASGHGEDDWAGMQLIVHELAQREDIPDEWWAEVGLSRTLGSEGDT